MPCNVCQNSWRVAVVARYQVVSEQCVLRMQVAGQLPVLDGTGCLGERYSLPQIQVLFLL